MINPIAPPIGQVFNTPVQNDSQGQAQQRFSGINQGQQNLPVGQTLQSQSVSNAPANEEADNGRQDQPGFGGSQPSFNAASVPNDPSAPRGSFLDVFV